MLSNVLRFFVIPAIGIATYLATQILQGSFTTSLFRPMLKLKTKLNETCGRQVHDM